VKPLRYLGSAIALGASLTFAQTALAQQPVRAASISGTVKSSYDSSGVQAATVVLIGSPTEVRTDAHGAFKIEGVSNGVHRLDVRRLGYIPETATVNVLSDGEAVVRISLTPTPRTLAQIDVRGRENIPSYLRSAYDRAERSHGAVFTAEEIAARNPFDTKTLLERLPGVRVNDRGLTFERCQGGLASAPGVLGRISMPSPPAKVQVYVDGIRLTGVAYSQDNRPENASDILQGIHPMSIQLMEVYTGIARIPGEFVADACAVIAIWTKRQ
jgi:hypothetical protein